MASLTKRNNNNIMEYTNPFLNPTGAVTDNFYGAWGSSRHIGSFTEDNSYYQQYKAIEQSARSGEINNQDLDALYERAVEEQVRLDNLAMTEELNWRKLQEQRAYDSDVAQVARARAAGINLELARGSGSAGSSSASMPATNIEPVQGQSKFSNAYDNASQVFNGITSVASAVSALSSAGSTIMQGISSMTMLPIQRRIQNVTANVAEQTAGSAISLSKSSSAQASLDLVDKSTMLVGKLAGVITNDVSDEDAIHYLQSTGISNPDEMLKRIRFHHNSPAEQANYQELVKRNTELSAYNKYYTPELIGKVYQATSQSLLYQKDTELKRERFANSLASLVNENEDYLANTADSILTDAKANSVEADTKLQKAKRDNVSFINYINLLANDVKRVHAELISLDPTLPNYQSERDALDYRLTSLMTVGSESVNAYVNTMRDFFVARSMNSQYLNYASDGSLSYSDLLDIYAHSFYINYSFDKFVNGGISAESALKHSQWILEYGLKEDSFDFDIAKFNTQLKQWGIEQGVDIVKSFFKFTRKSNNSNKPKK